MTDELFKVYKCKSDNVLHSKRAIIEKMLPGDAINVPTHEAHIWVNTARNARKKSRQKMNREGNYTTIFIVE
jgi:hypothetical protein